MPIVLDFESAVDANLDAQADVVTATDDVAAEAAPSEVESTEAEPSTEADPPADVTATEQSTETPTEPPAAAAAAEWDAMPHDDQCIWLNARAIELDNDDLDELDLRDTENEEAWQAGVDSYDADDTASNCPYGPGVDCDAWLQGWLWQEKQES